MPARKPQDYKDYKDTIESHRGGSLALAFFSAKGCIKDVERLVVKGRHFQKHKGPALDVSPPPRSVAMVTLCPDDELGPFMQWVKANHVHPPERILFVYHPDCDLVRILKPWYDVFEEDPLAYEMRSYPGKRAGQERTVAQHAGDWYNDWIYLDAKGKTWPLIL